MGALLSDLRREFLLRRGCEGHTGGMRYIYMQKHTHGVLRLESFCWSHHTLLQQIVTREDQALLCFA